METKIKGNTDIHDQMLKRKPIATKLVIKNLNVGVLSPLNDFACQFHKVPDLCIMCMTLQTPELNIL